MQEPTYNHTIVLTTEIIHFPLYIGGLNYKASENWTVDSKQMKSLGENNIKMLMYRLNV